MDAFTVAGFVVPVLLQLLFTVAWLAYLVGRHRSLRCPDCGEPAPVWVSPFQKTQRMWRAGGVICPQCGCEADLSGRKVTADTPVPPFPAGLWAALGLATVVMLVGVYVASRSYPPAPPVVPPPAAAPPPAPGG